MDKKEPDEFYCNACWRMINHKDLQVVGEQNCEDDDNCKKSKHFELDHLEHTGCEMVESRVYKVERSRSETAHFLRSLREAKKENDELFAELCEVCSHPEKKGERCEHCFKSFKKRIKEHG